MFHFSKTDKDIDCFIRSRVESLRAPSRSIHTPCDFDSKIMRGVRDVERKRVKWLLFSFIIVSLSPLLARLLWNFVRHDFISLSTLPMGNMLVKIYAASMSWAALFFLLALGVLIGNRVYLGAWMKVPLRILRPK